MRETEKRIVETFKKAFPIMSELGKEKLLSYSEGMAAMAELEARTNNPPNAVGSTDDRRT